MSTERMQCVYATNRINFIHILQLNFQFCLLLYAPLVIAIAAGTLSDQQAHLIDVLSHAL